MLHENIANLLLLLSGVPLCACSLIHHPNDEHEGRLPLLATANCTGLLMDLCGS